MKIDDLVEAKKW